jgi:DNA mismatch repair protein MutH
MKPLFPPPKTINELMQRADALAGKTIGEIAQSYKIKVPHDLKTKKGWQGQFLEQCLGADSGNLSQPDFNHLGVELKTLPISLDGRVEESTYVCVLNLTDHQLLQWSQSAVCKKLSHVLWVPIAKTPNLAVTESLIASPFLWRPSIDEENSLKNDWEEALSLVSLGKVDQLNARMGEVLQVRPKAAHSRVTTKAFGPKGETIDTLPRGFYLRAGFTQKILSQNLKLD